MTEVSFWLQTDIQLPEIEVRLYPNKRHFEQGWECLKLTRCMDRPCVARGSSVMGKWSCVNVSGLVVEPHRSGP